MEAQHQSWPKFKTLSFCQMSFAALTLITCPASNAQLDPTADRNTAATANGGFVILNPGVAAMARQAYGLPKNTITSELAGMTIFPYHEASEDLQSFLNNTKFMGAPIWAFPTQSQIPTVALPMTDTVRRSIPIPNGTYTKNSAAKMASSDKKNRDEVPWMVAHNTGQAYQIPGDTDAIAVVAQRTMFSACAARTMVLRYGRMWIMTGSRPAAVLTKDAAIVVKPFSIAAVQTAWNHETRVVNFSGLPLEVQLAYEGKTDRATVEKGQELMISEGSSGDSDSSQQNQTTVIPTAVPGLRVGSAMIDPMTHDILTELSAITPPFNNPRMSSEFTRMFTSYKITPSMRAEAYRKQVLSKSNIATKTAINNLNQNAARVSDPKAYKTAAETAAQLGLAPATSPATPPVHNQELKTLRLAKGRARTFANSEINVEQNGKIHFTSGEGVFTAREPMVIRTNTFSVHLRAGATVHMTANQNVILVRNLGETQPESVKVRMGDHIFACGVGGELIAASSAPAIFEEMRRDGIARRNVQSTEAAGGSVVINKGEVSLTSLMQRSPLMRKLYKSNSESDKAFVADLMKTIVAMNMITGGRGNYRSIGM